jgi:hypothetical protein
VSLRALGARLESQRQATRYCAIALLRYCATALLRYCATGGAYFRLLQLSVPEPAGCTASQNSFFRWRSETVHQGRHYPHPQPIGGTQSTSASASRFVPLPYGLEAARFLVRQL